MPAVRCFAWQINCDLNDKPVSPRVPSMMRIDAALIAQRPFEVASRYRGPPPADIRENASDFDGRSAYLANPQPDSIIPRSPRMMPPHREGTRWRVN